LSLGIHSSDNKIVGDGGLFAYIEQNNVGRLLFFDNVYDPSGKADTVQKYLLKSERMFASIGNERVPV